MGIELRTSHIYIHILVPLRHDWPILEKYLKHKGNANRIHYHRVQWSSVVQKLTSILLNKILFKDIPCHVVNNAVSAYI